jgi:thiamine-phosphate pyrophosphorylase
MQGHPFILAVITQPVFFPGEADCLEGLLEAGLEKLHLRKPGAGEGALEALLQQLNPCWYPRLILHGSRELCGFAARYGIPQVHCPLRELNMTSAGRNTGYPDFSGRSVRERGTESDEHVGNPTRPMADEKPGRDQAPLFSTSLHSWEELEMIEGAGLSYVFMSPVFDSISKPGYTANPSLLQRPAGPYPCKVIGLGGIDKNRIGELVRGGWDGAAVLGWIWEDPGTAIGRYEQLNNSIKESFL